MKELLDILDNREKAFLIWIAFAALLALRSNNVRPALVSVLRTLLSRKILIVLVAALGWVCLEVLLLHWWLWNFGMVKDTVIWVFAQALVMVFNHHRAHKDASYFKRAALASFKIALVLEFLINSYVFHIVIEVLLFPLLAFLAAMFAFSETSEKYVPVRRLVEYVMGAIGLFLLGYVLVRLIGDVDSFVSIETLRRFVLPIALTLLFLPFVYALAVYTAYENLFVRIDVWMTDGGLARYTKRQLLRTCLFRLGRVNRFASQYAARLNAVRSQRDTAKLMSEFRRSIASASQITQGLYGATRSSKVSRSEASGKVGLDTEPRS